MSEKWMRVPNALSPYTAVFRGKFIISAAEKRIVEFSADEWCQLYLDGVWVINGPERGTDKHWYFQKVELDLKPGPHTLCIRQFAMGKLAPKAQMSLADGVLVRNLEAEWSCQIERMEYIIPFPDWGSFPRIRLGKEYNPQILSGQGGIWHDVVFFEDRRQLYPPALPKMLHIPVTPKEIAPGLYQFDNYVCADAVYHFQGHGTVKIRWAESPYDAEYVNPDTLKGAKNSRTGHCFYGKWDEFEINGPLDWPSLSWHAGRYIQVECTGTATCTISLFRTGYPLPEKTYATPLLQSAFRTLQCCSHDTFMDCPFYERMMYIGDARMESLCFYQLTDDHRLPEKALLLLADGQRNDGALPSRYPCHEDQYIPSFMFLWLLALNDYFKIHGKNQLVENLLPVGRKLLAYMKKQKKNGLLETGSDWNFIDWCDGWNFGTPIGTGPNCVLNLFYVMGLRAFSETSGEIEFKREADLLLEHIHQCFWSEKNGLYSDYAEHKNFSEHAQVLALLCGVPETDKLLVSLRQNIPQPTCSIYFSFYYLQICRKFNLTEQYQARMKKYKDLMNYNLTTLPEEFGNPRSDCHAWSSHILLETCV